MVLSARLEDTGEVVYAWDFNRGHELRTLAKSRNTKFISPYPDIEIQVFPVDAINRALHFRHASKPHTEYRTHPESKLHQEGKAYIIKTLLSEMDEAEKRNIKIVAEYPLPEIKRIADVAVIYPDGFVHIHECQLAYQSTDDFESRTLDYESIGYEVSWWIGKDADIAVNREWLKEFTDGYCEFHIGTRYCNDKTRTHS